jgi:hypothetical protein
MPGEQIGKSVQGVWNLIPDSPASFWILHDLTGNSVEQGFALLKDRWYRRKKQGGR